MSESQCLRPGDPCIHEPRYLHDGPQKGHYEYRCCGCCGHGSVIARKEFSFTKLRPDLKNLVLQKVTDLFEKACGRKPSFLDWEKFLGESPECRSALDEIEHAMWGAIALESDPLFRLVARKEAEHLKRLTDSNQKIERV